MYDERRGALAINYTSERLILTATDCSLLPFASLGGSRCLPFPVGPNANVLLDCKVESRLRPFRYRYRIPVSETVKVSGTVKVLNSTRYIQYPIPTSRCRYR